jgi:hypothetical protein
MSALGQKQTCAPQKAMSALPPIATLIAFFGVGCQALNYCSVSPSRLSQSRSSVR